MTTPVDFNTHVGKGIGTLKDFCNDNNISITDTNENGIFDENDTITYTVQSGDNLSKISRKYKDSSTKSIMEKNKENYSDFNLIKPGDKMVIPFGTKKATPQRKGIREEKTKLKTRDFGNIKTRAVTDERIKKLLQGEKISTLQKCKYYVDDKNGDGIFSNGDDLYKQVTVMLDAGHGEGKYLKSGQTITIPDKGTYKTQDNDTIKSIAEKHKVDADKLQQANPKAQKGYDPGAVSSFGNKTEAEINGLAVNELAEKLKTKGYEVVIGKRTDKKHLSERPQEKLQKRPDMYVSIHCNAATAKANGEEVIVRDKKDIPFGKAINDAMKADTTFGNRKLKEDKLMVLRGDENNEIAECLVELGFISNAQDYKKLTSSESRGKQLDAISKGIDDYYDKHK